MAAQALSPASMTKKTSLDHCQKMVRSQLGPISETANLDALVLLAHTLSRSKSWVLTHPEYTLSSQEIKALRRALDRLTAGEPLPYVLGTWAFYGMDFRVSPEVLIPRPETELLVEKALAWLAAHPRRRLAADLGTGSGCIAVVLAKHMPDLRVLATDISWAALQTARENASAHQVIERVDFIQGDLLDPFHLEFDLICANLPYIPTRMLAELDVFQREPTLALDGGPDGLSKIRQLIASVTAFLAPGGLLLLEIEAGQGPGVVALAEEHFPDARVIVWPDLAGHDRLVAVELISLNADR
jgi:release factor glutamine methyltransferase